MEKTLAFERAFIALVAEMVEERGMTHSEFGRRVFGETSGVRLWRWCRAEGNRGRRLALGEAYAMADVLGTDFPSLVWSLTKEACQRGLLGTNCPNSD